MERTGESEGGEMFSQKVEYALRAVVHLAAEAPAARTVEQIAQATRVPQAYLAKVIQDLVHKGVLRSQRGVGGGISLVKTPAELTILEVVNAVDPIKRIHTCPLGLAAHGVRLCPLHRRLDNALAAVEAAFDATTLAEVLAEPSESIPLCDFPTLRVGGTEEQHRSADDADGADHPERTGRKRH
jgi:Rrf2 family protein